MNKGLTRSLSREWATAQTSTTERLQFHVAVVLTSRTVFPDSSAWFLRESVLSNRRDNLRGVADGSEEILKRPAGGQVNADATSCFADARSDLKQLNDGVTSELPVICPESETSPSGSSRYRCLRQERTIKARDSAMLAT
jgi:hypothetical protein